MTREVDWSEIATAAKAGLEHMHGNKDKTMPTGKWEFNAEVTAVFDDMLANSIPDYNSMRSLTTQIGEHFLNKRERPTVIDLGASKGRAIEPFIDKHGKDNLRTYLYEVSKPMLAELSSNPKFSSSRIIDTPIQDVANQGYFAHGQASDLVLSILTLQFTPIEYRAKILNSISNTLRKGGGFILVEKVLGNTNTLDRLLVDTYYDMKAGNGYSQEQIAAKRKSLEGVLVPVTAKWNEDMLYAAGFSQVDCFYRNLNFAGWIAIK